MKVVLFCAALLVAAILADDREGTAIWDWFGHDKDSNFCPEKCQKLVKQTITYTTRECTEWSEPAPCTGWGCSWRRRRRQCTNWETKIASYVRTYWNTTMSDRTACCEGWTGEFCNETELAVPDVP